ncbi:MAG: hypothetical protein WDN04_20195 [Rhodospirillales bacterium]
MNQLFDETGLCIDPGVRSNIKIMARQMIGFARAHYLARQSVAEPHTNPRNE